MTIQTFSWELALFGGALIGLAAVIMMLTLGRITGISGIFSNLLRPASVSSWQIAFMLGLICTGFVWHHFYQPLNIEINSNPLLLIISGLLVGFGTRLGNGCTSGHGVCGISRLSLRSIAATIVFMAMAILTVFCTRSLLGL